MIANFTQLATTPLRKQALLISEAGLAASALDALLNRYIAYDSRRDTLHAGGSKFSLRPFQHVILVGIGTGSLDAVDRLQSALGSRLTAGMVIDEQERQLPRILSRRATQQASVKNNSITRELMELMRDCASDDVIITIQTGGDLLSAPQGIMLEDKRALLNALIESGASPAEISLVRNHLSGVRGGHLAKLAYPAATINLMFDDPANLGSLTTRDASTVHDAQAILTRYNALAKAGLASCDLFETPKEDTVFSRTNNVLIPARETARQAMICKASDLGYRVTDSQWAGLDSGQCWIGDSSPDLAVGNLPESGVLVTMGPENGLLVDTNALSGARKSGLAELDAENWGETVSPSPSFGRILAPLSVCLRPA